MLFCKHVVHVKYVQLKDIYDTGLELYMTSEQCHMCDVCVCIYAASFEEALQYTVWHQNHSDEGKLRSQEDITESLDLHGDTQPVL